MTTARPRCGRLLSRNASQPVPPGPMAERRCYSQRIGAALRPALVRDDERAARAYLVSAIAELPPARSCYPKRRARHADGARCGGGRQTVRHRLPPSPEAARRIAASLSGDFAAIRDAIRADRITWPGRPKTCIGGPPEVGVSQLQLQRPRSSFKSHISLSPDRRNRARPPLLSLS